MIRTCFLQWTAKQPLQGNVTVFELALITLAGGMALVNPCVPLRSLLLQDMPQQKQVLRLMDRLAAREQEVSLLQQELEQLQQALGDLVRDLRIVGVQYCTAAVLISCPLHRRSPQLPQRHSWALSASAQRFCRQGWTPGWRKRLQEAQGIPQCPRHVWQLLRQLA